jgi:chromosome segregation ATPase
MAEIVNIPGVITLDTVQLSIIAVLLVAFLVALIKWRVLATRTKSMQKMVDEMDTEKADMYSKLKNIEDENASLREKFDSMKKEYSEKSQMVTEKERSLDENSKTVNEKLKEIQAMEETIEMHRMKIGRLEIEKSDLERKLDAATKDMDKQMSLEKDKLKSRAQELTQKTKETLGGIKKENEELKKKYESIKERLSLWESVND